MNPEQAAVPVDDYTLATDPDPSAAFVPPPFSMRAVGGWAALLAGGVLLGQLSGLLRTLFIANQVGVASSLDAVLIALVFPSIIGSWLSNSMRVAIVPAYSHIAHNSGEAEARRFVGAVLTYLALASIAAVVLLVAFADSSVAIAGPGLTSDTRHFAALQVPILAPMLAFLAMANLLTAICQIGRRFLPIAASSAAGPLVGLLVTVALWDRLGIGAYAAGVTVDAAATVVVLAVAAFRQGLLPRPSLRADRLELKAFAKHVLPMTVGSGVLQLNLISDRAIATLLSTGAASALNYGQQIVSAPASALSTSWATVIYPSVVGAGAPGSATTVGTAMTTALRYTIAMFVPLAVATVALAPLVVEVVYGRGAFNSQAVRTTVTVVAAFAPMLVLKMIQPVFTAAHNARRRGTLMAFTGVLNAVLNVVLNIAFGSVLGVAGIALSSSVTLAFLLLFLAWRVPREEAFRAREVVSTGGRALLASLVPGLPIGAFLWFIPLRGDTVSHVLTLVICAVAGIVGYVLAAHWLGVSEPGTIVRALRKNVRRRFPMGRAA